LKNEAGKLLSFVRTAKISIFQRVTASIYRALTPGKRKVGVDDQYHRNPKVPLILLKPNAVHAPSFTCGRDGSESWRYGSGADRHVLSPVPGSSCLPTVCRRTWIHWRMDLQGGKKASGRLQQDVLRGNVLLLRYAFRKNRQPGVHYSET
jgi:hypothetical protein